MKKNNITGVLVLLVFAVFMVSVLMILLRGADLVQRITERDQRSYSLRTVTQYLTTRVRQADQAGAVSVRRTEQGDYLVFWEEIDGTAYETSVYCCDGYLREMFCQAGLDLPPEFGEEILPMKNLQVSRKDTLLQITVEMTDGAEETVLLHLRSAKEATP